MNNTSAVARPGLVGRGVLRVLDLYQAWSRPRPPSCRYVPTCSAYARQAVVEHGPARGLVLALRRLLRCHPLASSGFSHDPVPPPRGR